MFLASYFEGLFNIRYFVEEILLSSAEKNKKYTISRISLKDLAVARRLSELGFYSGAEVVVLGYSALKKTFLVEISSYTLSLRKSVCDLVFLNEFKKN